MTEAVAVSRGLRNSALTALSLSAQATNGPYRNDMNAAPPAFHEQARVAASSSPDPYPKLVARLGLARVTVETKPQAALAELKDWLRRQAHFA